MRAMMLAVGALTAVVAATAPASARDRTGFQAIATGDLASAERTLVAERRIYPDRPELMLNLAAVYAKTGRSVEAAALYRAAALAPEVAMQMPNGAVVSSRDVAQRGQGRLATVEVAAR